MIGDDSLDEVQREVVLHKRRARRALPAAQRIERLLAEGGMEALQSLPLRTNPLALFEALLLRSWALRHEDPVLMRSFAWLAFQQAQQLDAREYGRHVVFDLRCRALAEYANAYRAGDKLSEAVWALGRARELYELGTNDEDLEIRLVELEGALAADRRQFEIARHKLEKVFQFHTKRGNSHLAGRAKIIQGLHAGYGGSPEEGISLIKEGLSLLKGSDDLGLLHIATHNQLLLLTDAGHFKEAKRFRVEFSRELSAAGGKINEIKLRALEGRIDAGQGRLARAEATFREVRKGYESYGLNFEAAITDLDLVAALLAQGKATEAKETAQSAAKIFLSLQIEREALLAVILLREAFEMEKATAELVKSIAAFLRRSEHAPDTPFTPPAL